MRVERERERERYEGELMREADRGAEADLSFVLGGEGGLPFSLIHPESDSTTISTLTCTHKHTASQSEAAAGAGDSGADRQDV